MIPVPLDKDLDVMAKKAKDRSCFLINALILAQYYSTSFTGIKKISFRNYDFEISKRIFGIFFDIYRYICNFVPIKDKSELWRKPQFPFITEKDYVYLDTSKFEMVYQEVYSPKSSKFPQLSRNEIEGSLRWIENNHDAYTALTTKLTSWSKVKNQTTHKRKRTIDQKEEKPKKRARTNINNRTNPYVLDQRQIEQQYPQRHIRQKLLVLPCSGVGSPPPPPETCRPPTIPPTIPPPTATTLLPSSTVVVSVSASQVVVPPPRLLSLSPSRLPPPPQTTSPTRFVQTHPIQPSSLVIITECSLWEEDNVSLYHKGPQNYIYYPSH